MSPSDHMSTGSNDHMTCHIKESDACKLPARSAAKCVMMNAIEHTHTHTETYLRVTKNQLYVRFNDHISRTCIISSVIVKYFNGLIN